MAAIHLPSPSTASDPSSRSSMALVSSLVAFLAGFSALVAGMQLPNSQSHPSAVVAATANRLGPVWEATGQDTAVVMGDAASPSNFHDPIPANHHSEPIAMDDHEQLVIELARGTRTESAHLATIPLKRDLRQDLVAMAEVRHGRPVGNERAVVSVFASSPPGIGQVVSATGVRRTVVGNRAVARVAHNEIVCSLERVPVDAICAR